MKAGHTGTEICAGSRGCRTATRAMRACAVAKGGSASTAPPKAPMKQRRFIRSTLASRDDKPTSPHHCMNSSGIRQIRDLLGHYSVPLRHAARKFKWGYIQDATVLNTPTARSVGL